MKYLYKLLTNPLTWFLLIVLSASFYKNAIDDSIQNVVRSDGRGYYAYLPAVFIYNDPSFEKVTNLEEAIGAKNQIYLHKDESGNSYNKYFPGIAVLQIPFFLLACFISFLFNQPLNGYSDIFHYLFLFGNFFYFSIGIILFNKAFKLRFYDLKKEVSSTIIILTFASPLFFYLLHGTSISHLYSFGLFGVFSYLLMQMKTKPKRIFYIFFGLILGLIFLLRPTNLLILLVISLFFNDFEEFWSFIKTTFANRGQLFLLALISFLLSVSILFISWKWQTGHWIVWSYSGEGFNFFNPKFVETLFSYRIGFFVHTPIFILSMVGLFFMFRKQKYLLICYLVYFIFLTWIIASWWCWDYESQFGPRPYTEHVVFLIFPLFFLINKYKSALFSLLVLFTLLGLFRLAQWYTGVVDVARYNKSSYWNSLTSYGEDQESRWNYTRSCHPYGTLVSSEEVLDHKEVFSFNDKIEFALTAVIDMPKPRTNEWYYYSVQLEKKHNLDKFENIGLVASASSTHSDKRYYYAYDLFNDREEGKGEWSDPLIFEGIIYDNFQEYDKLNIYIWNIKGQTFELRNIKYTVSVYKDN